MIIKVLFLIVYSFFIVAAINLTYIVKKDDNVIHPSCIAEELERYAAIGWIYPIPDTVQKLPNITTKFLPTTENDYNCEFSKNSVCNTRWSLRDWKIDDKEPKTRDPLFDNRWEELATILVSNKTKEFSENFELSDIPRVTFSVRAEGLVELFFCSGWNPYNYPCYYFYVNYRNIYFKVYQTLPKNISGEFKKDVLQEYGVGPYKHEHCLSTYMVGNSSPFDFKYFLSTMFKPNEMVFISTYSFHYDLVISPAFSDILLNSEWRSFTVSFDENGLVKLVDLNLERTLIEYTMKEKINPLYMFMRSANSSLWKFHENRFLQTNTSQISRLGPQLTVTSKDLCISLLVNTCENCEMSFFFMNGTNKKLLKSVGSTKNDEWLEIKLKEENIQLDKVNLFVQTKFINATNESSGFWGIDNVRICNENEVKVTYLKLKTAASSSEVTCQVIKKTSWRPKPHVYNKIQDFPQVQSISGTNSIKLMWSKEDPTSEISYFVSYKANDLCSAEPFNPKRMKSTGFLSTKFNEVLLENLVPFTLYNVTVSTVLHENEKKLLLHTLETDELYPEELPYKVQVRPLDTAVRVSWEPVGCFQRYGRIVYTVIVSNKELNFTTNLSLKTDTSYEITGLQPFTHYTLTIISARNGRNIYQKKFSRTYEFNFTTSAGVAPPVKNLELYSIDKSSASLRFELPINPHGITREVQVNRCNALSFKKCKSTILPLRECPFWPGKYCADVHNLIPYQTYVFRVSLKNINTHAFGKEISVDGYTNDRVPGAPTNVTYRIVNCDKVSDFCHLNVTWLHPYDQNGTITAFNIFLNSTDGGKGTSVSKIIEEVYKIENNTYYSYYTYQIKFLSYSTKCELYIQSENLAHKSDFTHISVQIDDIGDHIDQSPKLILNSHSGFTFQLPGLDKRLNYYDATVVVQDYNSSVKIDGELLKNKRISDHLCHRFGNTWISQSQKVNTSEAVNIVVGNAEKERLIPGGRYCILFIISNNYKGKEHDVVYYQKLKLLDDSLPPKEASVETNEGGFNPLYLLLLVFLLIPIGFFAYRYMKRNKRRPQKNVDVRENVYESLPFEECESNCVENENYDKLIHK